MLGASDGVRGLLRGKDGRRNDDAGDGKGELNGKRTADGIQQEQLESGAQGLSVVAKGEAAIHRCTAPHNHESPRLLLPTALAAALVRVYQRLSAVQLSTASRPSAKFEKLSMRLGLSSN